MADRRLVYDLIGNDKVSATFAKVAIAAEEANRRMVDSSGRVSIAEQKLTDLRTAGKASATQLAAAEENVARLRRAEETASLKLSDAQNKLSYATRTAGTDLEQMGENAATGAGQLGLIGPAVVGGVALVGPAAGAATAAMVGLGAAAGTALLAYKGFQAEIKANTGLGKAITKDITGISAALGQLESTAAHGAATGVLSSLGQIKSFLPTLNPLVANLSAQLGHALSIGTGGLITGLKTMTPLMSDAGRYAEQLAQAFANFTASGQFKQFIDYARAELPVIVADLTDTGRALVTIGTALQPFGDQALTRIDGLVKGFNDLASAVTPLTKAVGGGGGLFGAFTTMEHIVDPLTKLLDDFGNKSKKLTPVQLEAAAATKLAADAADKQKIATAAAASTAGVSVTTYSAVVTAMKNQAQSTADAALQMRLENDAAGILKTSLDALAGKSLTLGQAQNAFDTAIVNVDKHVDKTSASLVGMSSDAVKNRGDILNLVTSAESLSEAYGNQTRSSEAGRQKLISLRQEIINNAVANGENRAQVTAFIDSVLKIPKSVPPTKVDIDKAKADAKLKTLAKQLGDATVARTVPIFADTSAAIAALQSFASEASAAQAAAQIVVRPGPGSAHPHGAAGIASTVGGLTWVGEAGPELVNLPRGSQVLSHSQSVAAVGGPTVVNNVTIHAGAGTDPYALGRAVKGALETYTGHAVNLNVLR